MGAVAACVPKQDCQVSIPGVINIQPGAPQDAPGAAQDGEVVVVRDPTATEVHDHRVPLVNLAQYLEKKEPCGAWLQPCCSQFTPAEAATIDPPEIGPLQKEMTRHSQEGGEVHEISEDISEELKLMGMEVWLNAALSREDDTKSCVMKPVISEATSYGASRQPEEEPGAAEEEIKASPGLPLVAPPLAAAPGEEAMAASCPSRSPKPLEDVVEVSEPLIAVDGNSTAQASEARPAPSAAPMEVDGEKAEEVVAMEETAGRPELGAEDAAQGDRPRLFHISALDLGDDMEEPAYTDRSAPLVDSSLSLFHVATTSSAMSGSNKPKPKGKRRTRAEVMLW